MVGFLVKFFGCVCLAWVVMLLCNWGGFGGNVVYVFGASAANGGITITIAIAAFLLVFCGCMWKFTVKG